VELKYQFGDNDYVEVPRLNRTIVELKYQSSGNSAGSRRPQSNHSGIEMQGYGKAAKGRCASIEP